MAITDAFALLVAIDIQSASLHEVRLVESRFIKDIPEKIIGDKAYYSDPLDEILTKKYKTDLIAPHKSNRKKSKNSG